MYVCATVLLYAIYHPHIRLSSFLFSSCLYNIFFVIFIFLVLNVFYLILFVGINVKLKGEANTCWATDRQEINHEGHYENESQTVTGHEEYFNIQYNILGSPSGIKLN